MEHRKDESERQLLKPEKEVLMKTYSEINSNNVNNSFKRNGCV